VTTAVAECFDPLEGIDNAYEMSGAQILARKIQDAIKGNPAVSLLSSEKGWRFIGRDEEDTSFFLNLNTITGSDEVDVMVASVSDYNGRTILEIKEFLRENGRNPENFEYVEQCWGLDLRKDKFALYDLIFKTAGGDILHSVALPVTWKYVSTEEIVAQIASAVSRVVEERRGREVTPSGTDPLTVEGDYYKILGVTRDATFDAIKMAYRKRAMQYHPDRGGTHEEMLRINEAWQVLSNPQLRKNYDYARSHRDNAEAQRTTSADAAAARARAESYPQNWDDFAVWIDSVFEEYGKDNNVIFGLKYPSAGRSILGWVFILGGAAAGLYAASLLLSDKGLERWQIFVGIALIVAGAWLGAVIHKFAKGLFVERTYYQNKQ